MVFVLINEEIFVYEIKENSVTYKQLGAVSYNNKFSESILFDITLQLTLRGSLINS